MGLELIAIAGVLLLGAGVTILVVNLGKARRLVRDDRPDPDLRLRRGVVRRLREPSPPRAARSTRSPVASATGLLGARTASERTRSARSSSPPACTARRRARSWGTRCLCAIAFSLLVLWLIPAGGGSLIFAVVLAVAAGVGGWFAPVYYVELKRRKRMELIDKQMPDMIDLLVVTIEAGLGILASMRVASDSMADPLGQELRLTLQEQRMGLSVGQAIESLGRRADAPNMRIFVRSITQGERLGVSIGTTMRNLSLEMRKRRRAMAEERAQKMPIKMLFPLIFFIFPALFIVILTPMIISIVDAFG